MKIPSAPRSLRLNASSTTSPVPVLGFNTEALSWAADSIDFWVNEYDRHRSANKSPCPDDSARRPNAAMLSELHPFRSASFTSVIEELIVDAAVCEVLKAATGDVYDLDEAVRGHCVTQVISRSRVGGTVGRLRLRLGHLLATYFSMLPAQDAFALDPLDHFNADGDELTVLGWATTRGVVLDLVHHARFSDERVATDLTTVLADGARLWPDTFVGVRYLPLSEPTQSRLYQPDGQWEPAAEDDPLMQGR